MPAAVGWVATSIRLLLTKNPKKSVPSHTHAGGSENEHCFRNVVLPLVYLSLIYKHFRDPGLKAANDRHQMLIIGLLNLLYLSASGVSWFVIVTHFKW